MANKKDTLGRSTFLDDEKDYSIPWTPSSIAWFDFLNIHGLASSRFLHRFTKHSRANVKSVLNTLTRMWKGDYIGKPDWQYNPRTSANSYHIYHLTERGKFALENDGTWVDAIRPSGTDPIHRYGIAAVTGSIHIMAHEQGVEFIPGHEQLDKAKTILRCKEANLTPDQLFALVYPDGTGRHVAVEFERSYADPNSIHHNPRVQNKSTKVYEDKIEKYIEYIGNGLYKKHLDTDGGIVVLFVFASRVAEEKFHKVLRKKFGDKQCRYILTQTVDGFLPIFKPQEVYEQLFDGPWRRHGCEAMYINTP